MRYNPFDKELEDINEDELSKLIVNEVDEGWYIEYKSQIPEKSSGKLNTIKIVKSIAAFANTKGGWIFWGVECKVNTASKICGINLDSYTNLQDQLSRIISSNINPTPIYHFKEVTLASGNVVFIIKVDESPTPPYITGNGVIYQRENNESNPIKDRYIIEKLSEKTEAYVKSIEDFTHFEDYGETVGQSESNQSFLELFLFPRPFDSFEFKGFFTNAFFRSVALNFYDNVDFEIEVDGEVFSTPLNLGFNSIYTSLDSIIIRPITVKNIIYKGTTVELFRNGNLKVVIPLYDFSLNNVFNVSKK